MYSSFSSFVQIEDGTNKVKKFHSYSCMLISVNAPSVHKYVPILFIADVTFMCIWTLLLLIWSKYFVLTFLNVK